jgi:hypothetical protein
MKKRFLTAMAAYAVLVIVALLTCHGRVLQIILIVLALLAVKTWIAWKAGW